MITTATAAFVLESGSQKKYDAGAIIYCEPTYMENSTGFRVYLRVQDSVSTEYIGEGSMWLTVTEVDAETGSGTGETAPWWNALQKAVKTKLLTYTGNGSTSFTVV